MVSISQSEKFLVYSAISHDLTHEQRLQIVEINSQNSCSVKHVQRIMVVIIDLVNQQFMLLSPNFKQSLLLNIAAVMSSVIEGNEVSIRCRPKQLVTQPNG